MCKCISFLFLASVVNIGTAKSILENYYWQEYKGVIPENALPAGYSENGRLIYIGQVLHDEKLIPGKIYENDENVYFEYGEQGRSTNNSVKIFCTDHVENFEWIPITVREIKELLGQTILVNGGYQQDYLTFIGRVHLNRRTEVGKVICREDKSCLALYVNENGEYQEYAKFEILNYNLHNKKNTTTDIIRNTKTDIQPILQDKNHL